MKADVADAQKASRKNKTARKKLTTPLWCSRLGLDKVTGRSFDPVKINEIASEDSLFCYKRGAQSPLLPKYYYTGNDGVGKRK